MCALVGRLVGHNILVLNTIKLLRPKLTIHSNHSLNCSTGQDTSMESPTVHLNGRCGVRGKVFTVKDNHTAVNSYLGIPFAEPPVGKLRFQPPQALQLWDGIKDATQYGPICPQPMEAAKIAFQRYPVPSKMSEDCLYLNVFSPVKPGTQDSHSQNLPVMVWIHGGGFLLGSSDIYDGRGLASNHNVVVVTINYRLGIFGFLYTPDGYIPGNMGMLDQIEALKWVQKYIRPFGGDPDNVTLFGESAGAISTSLHMVSPLAKGLFRRGICESGTALYPSVVWSKKNATKFLQSALRPQGCNSVDGREVETFLNSMSTEQITEKFFKTFGRVVDGHYLTGHPIDLYRAGKFHSVDLLCGVNTHEGVLFINMFVGSMAVSDKDAAEAFINMSMKQVHFRGHPRADDICRLVTEAYLGQCADDTDSVTEACVAAHADCQFTAPTVMTAQLHSGKSRTFVYEFCHRPFFSRLQPWVTSDHTDEIAYVFGEYLRSPKPWPESDQTTSKVIMKYWTNFAKYGNPNGNDVATKWPEYNKSSQEYIRLMENPQVSRSYKPDKMSLWNETVLDIAMETTQNKL